MRPQMAAVLFVVLLCKDFFSLYMSGLMDNLFNVEEYSRLERTVSQALEKLEEFIFHTCCNVLMTKGYTKYEVLGSPDMESQQKCFMPFSIAVPRSHLFGTEPQHVCWGTCMKLTFIADFTSRIFYCLQLGWDSGSSQNDLLSYVPILWRLMKLIYY